MRIIALYCFISWQFEATFKSAIMRFDSCVCVWQREEQTEKGFTLHAAGVIPDNFILNSFQLSWRSSVHPGHYFNIFPVLQFIAVSWFFNHYLHESFHSTPAHLHSLFFYKKAIQGSWSDWNFMLLRTLHFEEKMTTYYSLPPCSVTHSINLITISPYSCTLPFNILRK